MPTPVEGGGTLIDDGFNSGSGNIGSPWTVVKGTGSSSATYDANNQGYAPSTGALSAQAAKLVSGNAGAGVGDTSITSSALSSLTANTAEIRWWVRTGSSASGSAIIYDTNAANGVFYFDYSLSSVVQIYCDRTNPANTTGYGTAGYHTIGSWTTNTLYQNRVVLNFTNKTYTAWTRSKIGAPWTQLYKSGQGTDLPMRSASVTAMGPLRFLTGSNSVANITTYFDEAQYSNTGITDNDAQTRSVNLRQAIQRAATR